jgi:uncharacterized protein
VTIDFHVHLDIGTDLDRVVKEARELECRLAISAIGPTFHALKNADVADAIQKYPDIVIGMGYVNLGKDGPKKVKQLHKRGFRGLKMIVPASDYDDKAYYPIYAKAEELRMPILFHTGVVARFDVWAKEKGWADMAGIDFRKLDISSERMRPMKLDAVARAFPDLNIIMAHYCSHGRRDEAGGLLNHHPNFYADLTTLSSAGTKAQARENAKLMKGFTPVPAYSKLLFGTDFFTSGGTDRLALGLKSIGLLLDELKVSDEVRAKIMYGNAAELLGL